MNSVVEEDYTFLSYNRHCYQIYVNALPILSFSTDFNKKVLKTFYNYYIDIVGINIHICRKVIDLSSIIFYYSYIKRIFQIGTVESTCEV